MFNYELPFFNPTIPCSKEYELNELRFVVWLSIETQNMYRVINPTNRGVKMIADGVLELLRSDEMELPANDELAGFLYSEETQNDPIEVKKVLVWLMFDCYLGQWDFHDSHEDIIRMSLDGRGSNRMIQYASRSMCAFTSRAWPLSLKPQSIYAEMIRIDMEDDSDELAQAIEEMKFSPLGMYHITGIDDQSITVEDFKHQSYRVAIDSFDYSPQAEIKKHHCTNAIASFISLDNKSWHVNGLCSLASYSDGDFDTYSGVQRENEEDREKRRHQYDELVENNNGDRLFFFKDGKAFAKWMKEDLKLTNVNDLDMSFMPERRPLAIFIEPNGNMTTNFNPECIKHPNNKFYNQIEAREYGLGCFINPDTSSSEFAQYVIKNGLVPDAMLNDNRGMEHGRAIMQDNIEFLARCMRRDIDTDEPFTTRGGTKVEETPTRDTKGKKSYDQFIDEILELDDFQSKMHKQWFLIDADEISTVVEDDYKREFTIPTRELYEAHLSLTPDNITNQAVAPFISLNKNIPPATAILFNVMGRQHMWRKLFEALMKSGYDKPSK